VLGLAFMAIPGLSSRYAKYLDDVKWADIVDPEFHKRIAGAFKGDPRVIEVTKDLRVFRYHAPGTSPSSFWYSLRSYVYPGNARRYLALPNANTAVNVSEAVIPKGSRILIGPTSNKVGDPFFAPNAFGGGIQLYVPDPSIVRIIE